jgi:mono/diheme cytochrome c family protein
MAGREPPYDPVAGSKLRKSFIALSTMTFIACALTLPVAAHAQTAVANCGSCHAIPPSSGKHSTHRSEGVSCGTCHGTGYSNTTVNAATHANGVTNIASTPGWNASSRSCSNSCHGSHSWGAAGTVTLPPPPTTTDGAALYASSCSGCHGALASSTKKGRTAAQIQSAINGNTGGMGLLSSLTSAQITAVATALAGTTTPPPATDGAALYTANCAGCHGALASSAKQNRTATQIQNAINGNTGGMGSTSLRALTSAQVQAVATALAGTTTPPPATDGAALYTANCSSCHRALASSEVRGRSATQIRNAISSNTGGMGRLSSLTSTQISAIATVLADTGTTPPPTTGSCTSCHAAPPNTGRHVMHVSEEHVSCASCHGTGYDVAAKTVNAATHQDGRVQVRSSLRWSSSSRSCASACHGQETWSSGSSSGGDDGENDGSRSDDMVVADEGAPQTGGCGSTGAAFTVMVFAGLAAALLRRRMSRA